MNKLFKILLFFSAFCFLTFAFISPLNPPVGNWYQQFMPSLPNFQVTDVTFLDSLTGYAVTGNSSPNDSSGYILKTTNGGDNWILKFAEYRDFSRVKFIDQNTGFVSGGFFNGARIYKTTNAGENWFQLGIPGGGQIYFNDMQVLNEDTLWVVASNSLVGGVFRTTNGGANWQNQINLGSQNPSKIYMYNGRIGFFSSTAGLYKTTNSGAVWFNASNDFSFSDMFFIDSLTGWKASGFMKKTTNGGLNWANQTLPSGGNILITSIEKFSNVNDDTIFGVSGYANTGAGARGIIYRTTNGGNTWLFQIPDSSISIFRYLHVKFINSKIGWAYNPVTGVHTTTGGEAIWYTGIQQISNNIPKDFELKQNYPNPFNPRTVIPYKIRSAGYVTITAYDMLGRESQKLVSSRHTAGEYEVDFMGKFSASGVYFYRMEITDDRSKQLFSETKKMVLVK